jgi:hypothetical protein
MDDPENPTIKYKINTKNLKILGKSYKKYFHKKSQKKGVHFFHELDN